MRKIKFRGKRMYKNEWATGDLLTYDESTSVIRDGEFTLHVFRKTVGQYTGYKDATHTEVFEGDIVEFPFLEYDKDSDATTEEKTLVGYVRFSFGQWSVYIPEINSSTNLYGIASRKLEVIGNIHDNPELLEGDNA